MSQRENRDRRTLYCGNLHENVTDEILFELFLQSGPLENVTVKRDGRRSFAFVTFKHEESVPYAEAIMENIYLFNRPLRLSARSSNKDFNNNANEPYTPENYGNDLLHRPPSFQSSQQQQQQQPLPVPLFSNNDYNPPPPPPPPSSSYYSHDDRMPPSQRYERRKQHSYHPYNRNEQDYQNMKQRNGNYNHQRRGGGGYNNNNNNYYR